MIKIFSRTYTIRFFITHHLATPDFLTKKITDFCKEKDLNLSEFLIIDSTKTDPDNGAIVFESSYVQIKGTKKDFELLRNFLQEFHKSKIICIMTV